jgi:hypothetical protein
MATYPASQIIGKTLIAKDVVNLFRGNQVPDGQPYAFVQAGNPVGQVYSYLDRGPAGFFWQFESPSMGVYYARHQEGLFDIQSLVDQGALTTQELIEQQEQENSIFPGFSLPSLSNVALVAGVIIGGLILFNLTKK